MLPLAGLVCDLHAVCLVCLSVHWSVLSYLFSAHWYVCSVPRFAQLVYTTRNFRRVRLEIGILGLFLGLQFYPRRQALRLNRNKPVVLKRLFLLGDRSPSTPWPARWWMPETPDGKSLGRITRSAWMRSTRDTRYEDWWSGGIASLLTVMMLMFSRYFLAHFCLIYSISQLRRL